jgi:hypothetical protein
MEVFTKIKIPGEVNKNEEIDLNRVQKMSEPHRIHKRQSIKTKDAPQVFRK